MSRQYYHDDFNNGVVDCRVDSPYGRGVVSEGTSLFLATTSGQDCDWWYSVPRRGALAYMPLSMVSGVATWYMELTVSAINCPGNTYAYLACLIYDSTRMVWMGCQGTGPSYGFAYNYWNGGDSNLGSFSTALPVRLRFVWNKTTNVVQGYYWGPSQSDWVAAGSSYTMPWTPVWFGAGVKNWAGAQYGTANLSEMDIQYDLTPSTPGTTFDREGEYNAGVVDVSTLKSLSGETRHDEPRVGQGLVLNERGGAAGGIAAPAMGAGSSGVSDNSGFRTLSWQARHDQPPVGQGLVFNERGGNSGGIADPAIGAGSQGVLDSYVLRLQNADLQLNGTDSEGHNYFNGYDINVVRYIDNTYAAWNDPTHTNFTGYARDGYKYTNGVQDSGPVLAPWASEADSSTRSARDDFPIKAAIVASNSEVVIFDLDSYPTVKMWMRFNIGSGDSWLMVGTQVRRPSDIQFYNGLLLVAHGGSDGYMAAIDFKATAAPVAYLIGAANPCYVWSSGKTIVDRNVWNYTQTGGIAALTLNGSATWYEVAIHHDGTNQWIACATSRGPYVFRAWDTQVYPQGYYNGSCKAICFDRLQDNHSSAWSAGVLFYAIGTTIYRNGLGYKSGYLMTDRQLWPQRAVTEPKYVDLGLGANINYMMPGPPYLFVATDLGVFRVHQSTLKAELLYSIASGMGTYKILPGTNPAVISLRAFTLRGSSFLAVARRASGHLRGGVTLIRDSDNKAINSYQSPALPMFDGSGTVDMLTYT